MILIFLSGSCHVLMNLPLYGTKRKMLLFVTSLKSGLFLSSGFLQLLLFLVPEPSIHSSTPNRGIGGQESPSPISFCLLKAHQWSSSQKGNTGGESNLWSGVPFFGGGKIKGTKTGEAWSQVRAIRRSFFMAVGKLKGQKKETPDRRLGQVCNFLLSWHLRDPQSTKVTATRKQRLPESNINVLTFLLSLENNGPFATSFPGSFPWLRGGRDPGNEVGPFV